jgi:hypothetical protein
MHTYIDIHIHTYTHTHTHKYTHTHTHSFAKIEFTWGSYTNFVSAVRVGKLG